MGRRRLTLGFAFVVLAACSSESAVEECEALVDAYCAAWARCTASRDDEVAYHQRYSECVLRSAVELACRDAESTGDGYDECLAQLAQIECSPPFGFEDAAFPKSCIGAIQLK